MRLNNIKLPWEAISSRSSVGENYPPEISTTPKRKLLWTEGRGCADCTFGDLGSFLIDLSWTTRNGHDLERQFGRTELAIEGGGTMWVRARIRETAGTFEKLQADQPRGRVKWWLISSWTTKFAPLFRRWKIPSEIWNGHSWQPLTSLDSCLCFFKFLLKYS